MATLAFCYDNISTSGTDKGFQFDRLVFVYGLVYGFIYGFVYGFVHGFVYGFVNGFVNGFVHGFVHGLVFIFRFFRHRFPSG
jgi:hypothetical protein